MGESEPTTGDVRIDDNGDVQVFDGESWVTVESIYTDAGTAMRDGAGGDGRVFDGGDPTNRVTG